MRFSYLAAALLLLLGGFLVALFPEARGGSSAAFGYVAITFVVLSLVLAWRDIYAFALLGIGLGLFGLFCVWAVSLVGPLGSEVVAFGGVAVAAVVAGGTFAVRNKYGRGAVPDVLLERFGRRAVFEIDGLQLVGFAPSETPMNVVAPIKLYLQNCFDSPKSVEIALDDQPLFGRSGGVLWRGPINVTLGPSEVKLVHIPVSAGHAHHLSAFPYLCVRATGPRGKRTRPRRAPYAAHPVPRWAVALMVVVALPLFVVFVGGRGGVYVQLRFTRAEPLLRRDDMPLFTVSDVWPVPSADDPGASAAA